MNDVLASQKCEMLVVNEKIRVDISQRKLWEEFHRYQNEMILTSKGRLVMKTTFFYDLLVNYNLIICNFRCIYPRISFAVSGLEVRSLYSMHLKIRRADCFRYKYTGGEWHKAGRGEPESETKPIYPENGFTQTGQYWMSNDIRFGKVKITNNPKDYFNVVLTSMHKYCPILYVHKVYATPAVCLDGSTIFTNQYQLVKSFTDEVMEFIAVTAYQNQQIIEMKKAHNSYARGQRGGTVKSTTDLPNGDASSLTPSSSYQPPLYLPMNPLNGYNPYWGSTSSLPSQIHFPSLVDFPSSSSTGQPSYPLSSKSFTDQPNSSTHSDSVLLRSLNSGNTFRTMFHNLSKSSTSLESQSVLSPSPFAQLNLHNMNMWDYGTFWHPFALPYSPLVSNPSDTDSNI
ncbi:unnamed protein product [Thelazia callipaeda]|uniref:T-box domain-containing protein n=1 Tax=Thelazia callipaeda TaxID=103827 RepID=A0A0N5D8M4_THECL|nr:unnamed protein product [Thelazia callipaeda]